MKRAIEATRYLITSVYPTKARVKEWVVSALPIKEGDYISLDGKSQIHVIKIWQTVPATLMITSNG